MRWERDAVGPALGSCVGLRDLCFVEVPAAVSTPISRFPSHPACTPTEFPFPSSFSFFWFVFPPLPEVRCQAQGWSRGDAGTGAALSQAPRACPLPMPGSGCRGAPTTPGNPPRHRASTAPSFSFLSPPLAPQPRAASLLAPRTGWPRRLRVGKGWVPTSGRHPGPPLSPRIQHRAGGNCCNNWRPRTRCRVCCGEWGHPGIGQPLSGLLAAAPRYPPPTYPPFWI